jgi:hypothetical protein
MPTDPQDQKETAAPATARTTAPATAQTTSGAPTRYMMRSRQEVVDAKTGKRTVIGPWMNPDGTLYGAKKMLRDIAAPINNAKGGRVTKSGKFQLEKGEIIVPSRILRRKARGSSRKTPRRWAQKGKRSSGRKRMGEKEIAIGYEELHRLEIYCDKCGAGVLIDTKITAELGRFTQCPVCGHELSDKLKAAIVAFSRFFRETEESKSKIQFRIKAP